MLKRLSLISSLTSLIALSTVLCHAASAGLTATEDPAHNYLLSSATTLPALDLSLPGRGTTNNSVLLALSEDEKHLAGYAPDKAGLIKDTKYFFFYQMTIVGLLYISPQSISGWSDEQKKEFSIKKYKNNARHAVWDSDQWEINYALHPYWGSAYYVRARERGYDENAAFWYSAALSASFEFGFEAFFEEPSLQDLIVTPVAGSFLGMYFMKLRNEIRARRSSNGKKRWSDSWIIGLTDPLGTVNATTSKWLDSNKNSARLSPVIAMPSFRTSEFDLSLDNRYRFTQVPALGMQYSYRW